MYVLLYPIPTSIYYGVNIASTITISTANNTADTSNTNDTNTNTNAY